MHKSLFFKKGNVLHKVAPENIYYFQADGDYTLAIGSNEKYTVSMGISEIANLLVNDCFVQVHRSYLVNIDKIDAIDLISGKIHTCEYEIPVSKSKKNNLLEKLKIVK